MAEIRCPKCGSRMVLLTTTEDDLRYYVCSNRPMCTERIAVEDAWAYMWEEGSPAGKGAGGIRQSGKSSQSRAGTAVSRLAEGKLWLELILKRSKRKRKAPVDEVRDNDRDKVIHEPSQLPYQPQHEKVQGIQAVSGVKETSEPRSPVMPETADGRPRQRKKQAHPGREEVRGDYLDDEIHVPRDVDHEPKPGMIPQAASRETDPMKMREVAQDKPERPGALEKKAASERKEPTKAWPEHFHEEEAVSEKKTEIHKEKKSSRRWWRRAPEGEATNKGKELSKPRTQIVLKRAASSDEKELLRPVQQVTEANLAVPEIKEPDKPVEPMAPGVYETDRAKESLSPQPPGVMQSDMDARKNRRFLIIILIAMVVACIVVIAGMIYAVLVLR